LSRGLVLFGLSEKELDLIINFLKTNSKIKKAVLFGSRVLGNYKPGSDVDIAIMGEELGLQDIALIQNQIEETTLPYKFDIVNYQKISNKELIRHIDYSGKEIYTLS
jgi:uncharacterized protein